MTATSRAPSFFAQATAVREAPPLPSTTAFFPAKEMPARSAIQQKPAASVLKAYSFPSARRVRVLTLPMAWASGSMTSQKGITSRL